MTVEKQNKVELTNTTRKEETIVKLVTITLDNLITKSKRKKFVYIRISRNKKQQYKLRLHYCEMELYIYLNYWTS